MKKSQIILIAIIVVLLVAILGFKIGFSLGKKSLESTVAQYKKIIDYNFPVPEEMFSISGDITEIQDRVLSVKVIDQDPYTLPSDWEAKTIRVTVTDETKITKFDMGTATTETIASLSELRTGNRITAGTNMENIKGENEFIADFVELFIESTELEIMEPELPEIVEPEE